MIDNNLPQSFLNLPEQYQRCIAEYLHSLNWSEAYHRVYGGDRKNASSNAHVVYNRPEVKQALQDIIIQRTTDISETFLRLQELAKGKQGDYLLPNKTLDFKRMIAEGKGYLVKKIRPTKYGDEIEFYDYQRALETMAKIQGLFDERSSIEINVHQTSIEDKIAELRNKLNAESTETDNES